MECPLKILVVHNSEDDRFFLRRILQQLPEVKVCAEAEDGQETIEYLGGEGRYTDRERFPLPDLLLLDLKMPRKTGYEVLHWLKLEKRSPLAVIVLSDSFLQADQLHCEELGALAYCRKGSHDELMKLLKAWIQNRLNNALAQLGL